MTATPDWMRDIPTVERPESGRSSIKGVLIWVAAIVLATFAVLAIRQMIG